MAFKDFALQLLGQLFHHILVQRDERVTIIGATSGDTGSAAIEGCRHSDRVRMFILHPHQRISDIQRKQMTTVLSDHIHNIALEGAFDDCQDMVKHLFAHPEFLGGSSRLVAVNSINWCRIMAQIVYYFYAALKLGSPQRPVSFVVPTGNFGDVFAGYVAHRMGLPVHKLIVATNVNDIVHRFVTHNDYSPGTLVPTLAPSMDIQISSNFERLLYDLFNHDGARVASAMKTFRQKGLSVSVEEFAAVRSLFHSCSVSDEAICDTIRATHESYGYLADPHTATALYAAQNEPQDPSVPIIVLATAHPVKFPEALQRAGLRPAPLPKHCADLMTRPERVHILPNDIARIQQFITNAVTAG